MWKVTVIWFRFGVSSYVIFEAIYPSMESASGNAHTDMVSLWYEFLCDSFAKPFSAMLTLIWFLFGMSSYVILLQNLFHNTHIEMFFVCLFVCLFFGMGSYV